MDITVGMKGEAVTQVEKEDTAQEVGSGELLVYATPCMAALMEGAACNAIAACIPEGADAVISEQHAQLLDFLDNDENTLVLCRAAVPFAQAGPGFAYAAPGRELRSVWQEKMTNAISGASLVPGWLPVYGPETIAELEPVLAELEKKQ